MTEEILEPYWWVQEGYSARPMPCYVLRCDREGCGMGATVHSDTEAKEWQEGHTKYHERRDNITEANRLEAERWAAQGGRPVKIQKNPGTYMHAPYAIKDAETTHVIVSGMRIEEAREYAETRGWKIVGWPRGYKP